MRLRVEKDRDGVLADPSLYLTAEGASRQPVCSSLILSTIKRAWLQALNAPDADDRTAVANALQPVRLKRYFQNYDQNIEKAFEFYCWNISISSAFHFPTHIAEVCCRNSIHRALVYRLGENWFENKTYRGILGGKFLTELDGAIADERDQHGDDVTGDHVASALTFGFWEHMATKRFERLLWNRGIRHNFPEAPWDRKLEHLHELIESVRRWRNRIAHHRAIFDKRPTAKYQDCLDLIGWSCSRTRNWVAANATVTQAIQDRPT